MNVRTLPIVVGVACAVCVSVSAFPRRATAGQETPAPIATPPEITIQPTPAGPMLADLKGFTLYVTVRDKEPGKSTCFGPCTEQWVPVRALADTKPFGDWSLVPRDDGRPQWAYMGRPLYRYRLEAIPRWAEAQGDQWNYASLNPFPPLGASGRRGFAAGATNVKIVLPTSPGGVTGQPNRSGGAMFADAKGMTLYSRSTATACSGACLDSWIPLPAPQAAVPLGEWTIVATNDGNQWAFRGRPVYRSVKDLKATDTNGAGDDWYPIPVPPAGGSAAQAPTPAPTRKTPAPQSRSGVGTVPSKPEAGSKSVGK